MTFFLLRLKVSRPPNLPVHRSSSFALHMIEASMPSSYNAAPIMCNGQKSGFAIRILLARAPDSSSLGAVPFASEEELAPLRVLRYTHCSILSSCPTRCCSTARTEKGEMLSCSSLLRAKKPPARSLAVLCQSANRSKIAYGKPSSAEHVQRACGGRGSGIPAARNAAFSHQRSDEPPRRKRHHRRGNR